MMNITSFLQGYMSKEAGALTGALIGGTVGLAAAASGHLGLKMAMKKAKRQAREQRDQLRAKKLSGEVLSEQDIANLTYLEDPAANID